MIRLIRLMEWRRLLKQYQKSGRCLAVQVTHFNLVNFYRVTRVGWTLVELEALNDLKHPVGVERFVFEIEDLIFAMTRTREEIQADLALRMPEVDRADENDPPYEEADFDFDEELEEDDEEDDDPRVR